MTVISLLACAIVGPWLDRSSASRSHRIVHSGVYGLLVTRPALSFGPESKTKPGPVSRGHVKPVLVMLLSLDLPRRHTRDGPLITQAVSWWANQSGDLRLRAGLATMFPGEAARGFGGLVGRARACPECYCSFALQPLRLSMLGYSVAYYKLAALILECC